MCKQKSFPIFLLPPRRSVDTLGNECRNFSLFLYQSLFENSFDFVGIDTALVLLFVCDVKRRNVIVIVGIF